MLNSSLKAYIEQFIGRAITQITPVTGGDISQAYRLDTPSTSFFCKTNRSAHALEMFLAEKMGLEAIGRTSTVTVPKVVLYDQHESVAFLVMEYVESIPSSKSHMEVLGHQLGQMHLAQVEAFYGWETDNFIGSLPQSNQKHDSWIGFYCNERLKPQLKMARNLGYLSPSEIPSDENLEKTCDSLFPETRPSLLHGDLWSGNFLIDIANRPMLIDPAVYYGHYEVDLAMTRLFGGFGAAFYSAHAELIPPEPQRQERNDLYQLYYLLVHLNLFGPSYYGSVSALLKRYFSL